MADAFVVAGDGGQALELPGWSMLVKVGADATGGALTVVQARMDGRHAGPAEHIHDAHDETFLVLEGALRFRLGDRYQVAGAGSMVFAPRGHAHGFSNPFEQPASYIAMLTPSGYERYFERVADHVRRTGEPPNLATSEEWMATVRSRLAEPASAPPT